jgi:hypothetical protein
MLTRACSNGSGDARKSILAQILAGNNLKVTYGQSTSVNFACIFHSVRGILYVQPRFAAQWTGKEERRLPVACADSIPFVNNSRIGTDAEVCLEQVSQFY